MMIIESEHLKKDEKNLFKKDFLFTRHHQQRPEACKQMSGYYKEERRTITHVQRTKPLLYTLSNNRQESRVFL